jgi:hypothetical protein
MLHPDNHPGLRELQKRIRQLDKNQRQLARLWDVDPGVVSKFFASTKPFLPLDRAKKLAEFVEMPLAEVERLVRVQHSPALLDTGVHLLPSFRVAAEEGASFSVRTRDDGMVEASIVVVAKPAEALERLSRVMRILEEGKEA